MNVWNNAWIDEETNEIEAVCSLAQQRTEIETIGSRGCEREHSTAKIDVARGAYRFLKKKTCHLHGEGSGRGRGGGYSISCMTVGV